MQPVKSAVIVGGNNSGGNNAVIDGDKLRSPADLTHSSKESFHNRQRRQSSASKRVSGMGSKSGRQSIVSAMIPSPSKLNAHRHMSGVYASHSFPGSNSLDDDPHSLSRRRTMFGSQGQLRNRFNLQFFDEHIERRYQQFHRHLSLPNWRWTIGAMLMVEMVSFIYMIIALPKESALLEQQRLECTPGSPCFCPRFSMCTIYQSWREVLLMLAMTLSACAGLIVQRFYPTHQWLAERHQWWSALIVSCFGVMIIIRPAVLDPTQSPFYSTTTLIVLLLASLTGIQLTFSWSAVVCGLLLFLWLMLRIPVNYALVSTTETVFAGLLLLLSTFQLLATRWQDEINLRRQFVSHPSARSFSSIRPPMPPFLPGQNTNGIGSGIAGSQAALVLLDTEAPLEKSMTLLRSVMLQISPQSQLFAELEQAMALLSVPQLLVPDMEGQLIGAIGVGGEEAAEMLSQNLARQITAVAEPPMNRLVPSRSLSTIRQARKQSITTTRRSKDSVTNQQSAVQPPMPELPRAVSLEAVQVTIGGGLDLSAFEGEYSALKLPVQYAINRITMAENASADQPHQQQQQPQTPLLTANSWPMKIHCIGGALTIRNHTSSKRHTAKCSPAAMVAYLTQMSVWDWRLHEFAASCPNQKPLFILIWHLFESTGLFEEFRIPIDKFNSFMWLIQEGYRDLPYHNSLHAADVVHAVTVFCNHEAIQDLLSPLELMALIFAATIHDFDHPGVTNLFLNLSNDPLAVLYNNQSVLESYHSAAAFEMLRRPENNFLENLDTQSFNYFRDLVVQLVLSTDLAKHHESISLFRTRVQGGFNPFDSKDDRLLLMKMLIKCADVSNPTKEMAIYEKWIYGILEEWRFQGDQERRLGMKVAKTNEPDNDKHIPSSQLFFINNMVYPIFEALHFGYLPNTPAFENLQTNREHWLVEEEKRKMTIEASSPAVKI